MFFSCLTNTTARLSQLRLQVVSSLFLIYPFLPRIVFRPIANLAFFAAGSDAARLKRSIEGGTGSDRVQASAGKIDETKST